VPTIQELTTLATAAKIENTATAFSSFLKLPAPGSRTADGGRFFGVGTGAPLWSRSVDGEFGYFFAIYTNKGNTAFHSISRAHGFSVRCIKD
jgi:hypothetical protein